MTDIRRRKALQKVRHVVQAFFFLLLVFLVIGSVCSFVLGGVAISEPLGGLQVLVAGGWLHAPDLLVTFGISLLLFVTAVLLLGRAWCAWACPIGSTVEFTEYLMKRRRIKPRVDRRGASPRLATLRRHETKYGILGGVLASAALTRSPAWCSYCPIGTVCRGTAAGGMVAGLEMAVVGAVAATSFYERRFFCKYLCPVAGLLTAISRFNPFLKPRIHRDRCPDCGACDVVCPEGLQVSRERTFAECTKCFVCYSKCPYGSISIGLVGARAGPPGPPAPRISEKV